MQYLKIFLLILLLSTLSFLSASLNANAEIQKTTHKNTVNTYSLEEQEEKHASSFKEQETLPFSPAFIDVLAEKIADKLFERFKRENLLKDTLLQKTELQILIEKELKKENTPTARDVLPTKDPPPEQSTVPTLRDKNITKILRKITGTWYNTYNKPFLYIEDEKLNGFPIVDAKLQKANQELILTIKTKEGGLKDHLLSLQVLDGDHSLIAFDNMVALRKTRFQSYHESVCSIHLGMAAKDVLSLYGKPDSVKREKDYIIWQYKAGFRLRLFVEVVTDIYLDRNTEVFFDTTELSPKNSLEEFHASYHLEEVPVFSVPTGAMKITGDEYLFFDYYPGEVRLSIFNH